MFEHHAESVLRHGTIIESAVDQCLEITADDGQRGAQLVRDIGHEFAPHLLEAFDARDVVDDDNGAGRLRAHLLERRDAQFVNPPGFSVLDDNFATVRFFLGHSLLHEAVHGGMTECLDNGAANGRGSQLEHRFYAAVGVQHAEAAIDGKNTFGDAGHDGVELGTLAVRGAVEVSGLAGDGLQVALRGAQSARQVEGERASDIAIGHAPQAGPQAPDTTDVAEHDKGQRCGGERCGDPPPVQPAASPVLKR